MHDSSPAADLGQVVERFLAEAHEIPPHRLAALIASTAGDLGARSVVVWLADHQQRALVHLPEAAELEPLAMEGSVAGRSFITGEVVVTTSADGVRAMFPMVNGVDRIGVLQADFAELTSECRRRVESFVSMATADVVTRGQYTDLFTSVRRLRPMSLSAELQWQMLPPNSFTSTHVAAAGMMEPAYDVGGDSFDYAHSRDRLQFAAFDAVGHDLRASMISTLVVSAYRHARRSHADLVDAAGAIDEAVRSQFGASFLATGQLGDLDTSTGVLRWLNVAHPPPLRIRQGHVSTLDCPPRLPFGLPADERPHVAEVQLEPGDGVLLYTDGVIEAKRAAREDFGVERLGEFLRTARAAGHSPAETLRRLSNAVLDFNGGMLQDDATTLLVVWRPEG